MNTQVGRQAGSTIEGSAGTRSLLPPCQQVCAQSSGCPCINICPSQKADDSSPCCAPVCSLLAEVACDGCGLWSQRNESPVNPANQCKVHSDKGHQSALPCNMLYLTSVNVSSVAKEALQRNDYANMNGCIYEEASTWNMQRCATDACQMQCSEL